mgnify:CR=1 FL=1
MTVCSIAHNINQMLQVISHCAELLSESSSSDILSDLQRANQEAARYTGQLMAFGQAQSSGEMPLIDLSELLRDLEPLLLRLVGGAGKLEMSLEQALVRADDNELRQMVLNLVINAAESYANSSGPVRIWVRGQNQEAELIVQDEGCGIAPELVNQIFRPFVSSKRKSGRGLGLSQVSSTVSRHRGALDVESQPGRGTTFRVRLPQECRYSKP